MQSERIDDERLDALEVENHSAADERDTYVWYEPEHFVLCSPAEDD